MCPIPDGVHGVADGLGVLGGVSNGVTELVREGLHLPGEVGEGRIQFLHGVRPERELHMGLQLAHDAAHILAAEDAPCVAAGDHRSALEPHDAAGVVAQMGVSQVGVIFTELDGAGGTAGDAAGVAGCAGFAVLVDGTVVHTVLHEPVVVPDDAAGVGGGLYLGLVGTAADHAAGLVDADQPAHPALSLHLAGDGAVSKCAAILSNQNSHIGAGPIRGEDGVLHRQIGDHRARLDAAEQAGLGTPLGVVEVSDLVAVSVEGTTEDRDRGKSAAREIQIGLKLHGQPFGIGVTLAGLSKV